jgi:hypothetical protein
LSQLKGIPTTTAGKPVAAKFGRWPVDRYDATSIFLFDQEAFVCGS